MNEKTRARSNPAATEGLRSDADALMTIAIMAASAKGGMEMRKLTRLQALARHSPEFRHLQDVSTYVCIMVGKTARDNKTAALQRSVATLSSSLRKKAYAWARAMTSDSETESEDEGEFLNVLRRRLKIPHQEEVHRLSGEIHG
ncbi:MAG: hypothetical protein ABIJ96_17845 [Elusimicrobiota bacterium]